MNRMMRILACLSALILFLSGCSQSVPIKEASTVTLPPVSGSIQAPIGDGGEEIIQRVSLTLPSLATGQLTQIQERLPLPATRHPAEAVLTRLLSYPSNQQVQSLDNTSAALSLMPGRGVEVSGGTALVNLSASALVLDSKTFFQAAMAITNTLAQWGDIQYVNILVNDQHPGIDPAATIPLGSLTADSSPGAADKLWEARSNHRSGKVQGSFSLPATLYVPAAAGRGIVAEGRVISFPDASLSGMCVALLAALSQRSSALPNLPQVPDLKALLAGAPLVDELPGAQGRIVQLSFHESANEQLIAAGIPRSIMLASICQTLTTFLPGLAGVKVRIGNEMISAVVPAGVLEGAGQEIVFQDQVMKRRDFSRFLLDYCTLYFANSGDTLSPSLRAIPYYQAHNPRYVLNQLLAGPDYTDSVPGLSPVLPTGLKDADWLGITRQNDTLAVNLSAKAAELIKPLGETQERLMVYGLVNTLARLGGVTRVQFFIDGSQEGRFARQIDLAGSFLPNTGLVTP